MYGAAPLAKARGELLSSVVPSSAPPVPKPRFAPDTPPVAIKGTVVPSGAIRLMARSPTAGCAMSRVTVRLETVNPDAGTAMVNGVVVGALLGPASAIPPGAALTVNAARPVTGAVMIRSSGVGIAVASDPKSSQTAVTVPPVTVPDPFP